MSDESTPRLSCAVVAVAASAGGVSALQTLLAQLPEDLPAVVLVIQHLDRTHRSHLPDIISRVVKLPVHHAQSGEVARPGIIYVAPPDEHLLLNADGSFTLAHTELVHFVRPSADLLFESVAAAAGERALAVVLTGTGRDGALGTNAIHDRGGRVIAQDERTSEYFGMPGSAISTGSVDAVLPLDKIAEEITSFAYGAIACQ